MHIVHLDHSKIACALPQHAEVLITCENGYGDPSYLAIYASGIAVDVHNKTQRPNRLLVLYSQLHTACGSRLKVGE
jgi:hypothetical protein